MMVVLLAVALAQAAHAPGTPVAAADAAARPSSNANLVTRRFTPLPDGGVFEVSTPDRARVARVRERLRGDAARFAKGAFRHPRLSAGAANIEVAYADTDGGGRVRFITSDPALVQALHAWLASLVRQG